MFSEFLKLIRQVVNLSIGQPSNCLMQSLNAVDDAPPSLKRSFQAVSAKVSEDFEVSGRF